MPAQKRGDSSSAPSGGGNSAAAVASAGGAHEGRNNNTSAGRAVIRVVCSSAMGVGVLQWVDSPLLHHSACRTLLTLIGVVIIMASALAGRSTRGSPAKTAKQKQAGDGQGNSEAGDEDWDGPDNGVRWSLVPSTGTLRTNTAKAVRSENAVAHQKFLVMHKPTHDPESNAAGDYPYSWHLHGRRRIWEVRVQIQFKKDKVPSSMVYFGLEMIPGPQNSSMMVKRVQGMIIAGIRSVIGKEFYQTTGDDPEKTEGECEPPAFAMPLWALDQFVVSDPGEEPDISGNLEGAGYRRTDGMKAYKVAMQDMMDSLSADKVYTLCFWGVSQFIDVVNWEFKGLAPGLKLDANKLCGKPPIFVVAYELQKEDGGEEGGDSKATSSASSSRTRAPSTAGPAARRHYDSQKSYLFKVALWSNARPPETSALQELLGDAVLRCSDRKRTETTADEGFTLDGWPITQRVLQRTEGWPMTQQLLRRTVVEPLHGMLSKQNGEDPAAARRRKKPVWVSEGQKLLGGCLGAPDR